MFHTVYAMTKINGRWKVVFGDYLVSSSGDIYSCKRGRLLKPTLSKKLGYVYVNLGRSRRLYVHQLVMRGFHGTPADGEVVDHIDGDRQNNDETNLRYLPKAENDGQCIRVLIRKCAYIDALRSIYSLKGIMSAAAVAKRYAIPSPSTVHNIWTKKTWASETDKYDEENSCMNPLKILKKRKK